MIVSFEGFLYCVRVKFLSLFVLEYSEALKIAFRIDFRRFSIWRLYIIRVWGIVYLFTGFTRAFSEISKTPHFL